MLREIESPLFILLPPQCSWQLSHLGSHFLLLFLAPCQSSHIHMKPCLSLQKGKAVSIHGMLIGHKDATPSPQAGCSRVS